MSKQVLVLQRKVGEKVILTVGNVRIAVSLVDVRSSRAARLGFEAPPEVLVLREEIAGREGRARGEGRAG